MKKDKRNKMGYDQEQDGGQMQQSNPEEGTNDNRAGADFYQDPNLEEEESETPENAWLPGEDDDEADTNKDNQ